VVARAGSRPPLAGWPRAAADRTDSQDGTWPAVARRGPSRLGERGGRYGCGPTRALPTIYTVADDREVGGIGILDVEEVPELSAATLACWLERSPKPSAAAASPKTPGPRSVTLPCCRW
jgi:hypothetical protein